MNSNAPKTHLHAFVNSKNAGVVDNWISSLVKALSVCLTYVDGTKTVKLFCTCLRLLLCSKVDNSYTAFCPSLSGCDLALW